MNRIETRAIIVIFNGTEPNPGTLSRMFGILANECNVKPGEYTCKVLDVDDITNATVKAIITKESKIEPVEDPIRDSIVVVGQVLGPYLGSKYKPDKFIDGVVKTIEEAKDQEDEMSKAFMRGLEIISQFEITGKDTLLRRYRLDQQKLSIIRTIYNMKRYG